MPNPKATDASNQADLAVLKAFRKKHPDVALSQFSGISIAGQSMDSQVLLAIAGGNAPDVLYVNFRQSDTYIQQSFLYPLDEFFKKYGITQEELDARILPPVRPVATREGPLVKGVPAGVHTWCVPFDLLVRTLFYRKDIFEEVGLDPDKPPQDWNELYEAARRISDPSLRRFGLSIGSGPDASWDFVAYLWSAGGEAVVKNAQGEWVAAFDSDAAAVALDFYLKLTCEKWTDTDGKQQLGYTTRGSSSTATAGDPWVEGRLGMTVNYLNQQSIAGGIDPSLVGIAPFPKGPGGHRGTELNCRMQGVFSDIQGRRNSKGERVSAEEVRDAAFKYLWFMDSEEARRVRVSKMVELGYGKMLNPIWLRQFGYDDYARQVPPVWEEVFKQAMTDGKPEPYGKNCQMVYRYMTPPIDEAMNLARDGKLPQDRDARLKVLKGLLTTAVDTTNRYMIGKITPQERRSRNLVASVVAVLLVAAFSVVLYIIWRIFTPESTSVDGKRPTWQFRKYYMAYLIMLPAVGSILLWMYGPMLIGSAIAFMDYRFVGGSKFVGLDNLADVLYSSEWWNSLWNSLRYMFIIIGIGFVLPIILAILLQEVSHGKLVYRVVYYLPAVMSGLVVIYMWKLFYQSDSYGVLNQVFAWLFGLVGLNFNPVAWLEDPETAMLCCVIPSIWAGAGPGCLIYLAALKGIPDDCYEAADIDGATFFHKVRHIVVPTLKALLIINFIGAFIVAMQSEGMILIMTYGSANTEVAGLHIFKEAYTMLRFGTAISMAWILGIALLGFTVLNLRKLSKMEFKTTGGK